MTPAEMFAQAIHLQQAGRLDEARELCERMLARDARDTRAMHLLATLARQAGRQDVALEWLTRARRIDAADMSIACDLALCCCMLGRFDEAAGHFEAVLAAQPGHVEAWFNLGNVQLTRGRLEDAVGCFRQALALRPELAAAYQNLGLALFRLGRLHEAADCYHRLLAVAPGSADAHLGLGLVRGAEGNFAQAAADFERARALNPGNPLAHYHLGLTYFNLGRMEEALAAFEQAIALRPDYLEAHINRANVLIRIGRLDEAATACTQALGRRPDAAEAHLTLALARLGQGQLEAAAAACRQAIALRPEYAEAHSNLGHVCIELRRLDEAVASCARAVALRPDMAGAHYNLGLAYFGLGRLDEAVTSYQRALSCRPEYPEALVNLGLAWVQLGRGSEALASLARALALDPDSPKAHSARLLTQCYLSSTTPSESRAAQRFFVERCEAPLRPQWRRHDNPRDPARRLRIGYVSPDFCRHSIAYFMLPVLARHDKAQVEVHVYYTRRGQDDVTALIRPYADHWTDCAAWTDAALAERVRADRIDILVDLSGHTEGNRLLAFARRPAPVQVTYLGYPGSTGLESMDYRLCTEDTDPPGAEAWHSERLQRLPRGLWCYRPLLDPDAPGSAGRERDDGLVFGSMNAFAKISPAMLRLWCAILRALPLSRLVMTSVPEGETRARLREVFAAEGIVPERVELYGKLPYAEYRALLARVDIALDPYPYNGTTTTCDTLWRGIPVVSLRGETSASRSGYALLKAVGLEDLAAEDEESYVRIAVALAQDAARRAALRSGLRARMEASALRDEAGFTRELEAAYRAMWRQWCDGGGGNPR
ncbi:MAG: tetratricopeptide repeat protein [Gammaproteobacteria bacterium]|nr:tetratricopeptide repeat protein [Gammaproteobacteria bacterium]